jgi:hypothetical protein
MEYDLEYRRKADPVTAVIISMFNKMQQVYNSGQYAKIADFYATNGKIIGKAEEINGKQAIVEYWKGFASLGGTWKLTNLETEQSGTCYGKKEFLSSPIKTMYSTK